MIDFTPVRAFLEPSHLDLATRVSEFGARHLTNHAFDHDDGAARARARKICDLLGRGGWLSPIVDQDFRAICVIRESLAFYSPLADAVCALQALGSTPIALAGNEKQRSLWLDRAARGEAIAAFKR